ncbi:putative adipose-regulatory protein-domain-containing protein [Lineolata rhizophorae]|uniref:Putative adipose-regulatory protein-domain-containing protein n=1 Tax=Lineolata rhizophorae TaxID=578093 RepID=A0A6A6NNJ4_9PEZI|nr:putative adipose-regulatory protein-domain-containing protein [Lineolata rhizophorae]
MRQTCEGPPQPPPISTPAQLLRVSAAMEDDDDVDKSYYDLAKDTILRPFQLLVSRRFLRTYLTTLLISIFALGLGAIATTAYVTFYYAYIPARGVSRPVHLQFHPSHAHPPHGATDVDGHGGRSLSRDLVSGTAYDVALVLELPRSRKNRDEGNFMLDLQLLSAEAEPGAMQGLGGAGMHLGARLGVPGAGQEVLARSRRPAMLTYRSEAVEFVKRILWLPAYVVGWRSESEKLEVRMMERVEFQKGWRNVPVSARVELVSEGKLQVYNVKVVFTAKLGGLRYVMYHYRITSFVFFTSLFWLVEMVAALVAWTAVGYIFTGRTPLPVVKRESTDDSGGPTIKRERQMSRVSSPHIKKEEQDQNQGIPEHAETGLADVEADVEDEGEDASLAVDNSGRAGRDDSGIGTSMESGVERSESIRRRRSGGVGQ